MIEGSWEVHSLQDRLEIHERVGVALESEGSLENFFFLGGLESFSLNVFNQLNEAHSHYKRYLIYSKSTNLNLNHD